VAKLEQLLECVDDATLRAELADEVAALKGRTRFGLVYERHLPETVVVGDRDGLKVGDHVRPHEEATNGHDFRLVDLDGDQATILSLKDGEERQVPLSDLLTLRRFGDPADVGLTPLGATTRSSEHPYHAVIEGENFHVLQLLTFVYEGQVDCIYIDPPYNTGARDWTYNNHYVDRNDRYRHSKWLAFMERRLRLARMLLKPDGVLVISIDENEHAHLVCLLDNVFRGWDITSVAIVHNPRGIQGDNFSHTNDFAVFVTPAGAKAIAKRPVEAGAQAETRFRVWGNESERTTAKNCFFPIYVQHEAVVGFGDVPSDDFHPTSAVRELDSGYYEVWPIDNSSIERKWRHQRKTIEQVAHLLRPEWVKGQLQIRIDKDTAMHKTVWTGSRYDAGSHGKRLLKAFGVDFDYPKSLYTMRDILYACVGDRKNAVVLDYLAGSGTTLHATCLLNAEDGGRRRCILVTNNEVNSAQTRKLNKDGYYRGDPEFEKYGIFEAVTRPRCEAAMTGVKSDGTPIEGKYLDGRLFSEGFRENIEFFRLDYLDGDRIELGDCFDSFHPVLWLAAGGWATRPEADGTFIVNADGGYAVLLDEDAFRDFEEALAGHDSITHVAFVTDSEEAYAEMCEGVAAGRETVMLYRDFLRHYRRRVRL
jgi:adenine-specific DNA-methyltransferase